VHQRRRCDETIHHAKRCSPALGPSGQNRPSVADVLRHWKQPVGERRFKIVLLFLQLIPTLACGQKLDAQAYLGKGQNAGEKSVLGCRLQPKPATTHPRSMRRGRSRLTFDGQFRTCKRRLRKQVIELLPRLRRRRLNLMLFAPSIDAFHDQLVHGWKWPCLISSRTSLSVSGLSSTVTTSS
jgi:hypothetical protein